jgi:hypothetical protein
MLCSINSLTMTNILGFSDAYRKDKSTKKNRSRSFKLGESFQNIFHIQGYSLKRFDEEGITKFHLNRTSIPNIPLEI